jgi:hypothetical protein
MSLQLFVFFAALNDTIPAFLKLNQPLYRRADVERCESLWS